VKIQTKVYCLVFLVHSVHIPPHYGIQTFVQRRGRWGGFGRNLNPTCLHGHLLDLRKTDEKLLGNPPPFEHSQSSASTKLLIAVKLHQNLQISTSYFPRLNLNTGEGLRRLVPRLRSLQTQSHKPLRLPSMIRSKLMSGIMQLILPLLAIQSNADCFT